MSFQVLPSPVLLAVDFRIAWPPWALPVWGLTMHSVLGGRFKKEIVVDGQSYLLLIRDEGGPPELQVTLLPQPRPVAPLSRGSGWGWAKLCVCGQGRGDCP